MRRRSAFERDFADLHGRAALREVRVEVVQELPAKSHNRIALALVAGSLGLFWSIVLGAIVLAMIVVGWAMISSL